MKSLRPSPILAMAVLVSQLFGPGTLWALEQRGVRLDTDRLVVSALSGDQLTVQRGSGTESAKFRTGVQIGDRIVTGARTVAEVLISDRTMVTLDPETTAQVVAISSDQTTIQVVKGMVRVAAAASAIGAQGLVRVQTPTSQVQTRGGIVRVAVDVPVSKAGTESPSAQAYRASYRSDVQIAATIASGDLIQVEEGTADLAGAGPAGGSLTIQAGQRVIVQAGRAGAVAEGGKLGTGTTGIVATTSHTQTPKEGRDHLVALQVTQATQLGKALTGAAETEEKQSDKRSDQKNAINGATGGVSLVTALFGTGNASNHVSGGTTDQSGTGYGYHNNNGVEGFSGVTDPNTQATLGNGSKNALLVFNRLDPIAFERVNDQIQPRQEVGTNKNVELPSVLSAFTANKELVLIGGNLPVGHGGAAPTERLIVRGLAPTVSLPSANNVQIVGSDNLFRLDPNVQTTQLQQPGGVAPAVISANSTFVVRTTSTAVINGIANDPNANALDPRTLSGGTLGQFSSSNETIRSNDNKSFGFLVLDARPFTRPDGSTDDNQSGFSTVDGAIAATGSNVVLSGGVTLDQQTTVTLGQTDATNNYFSTQSGFDTKDTKYSGSLMSVINGPGLTKLTMQERMLGIYDGSKVVQDLNDGKGKALLSVLDAKLVGPAGNIPLIDIAAGKDFDRNGNVTDGTSPEVTVTSAIVTRSTTALPAPTSSLDQALLNASAPLIALTKATMTTTSHFADLAGNKAQSLNVNNLNGALVALSAANLFVKGNLLNLNTATAAISGYLFSLSNGSTLDINGGSLFSMNDSSLALNGTAFGVFGSGTNTLKIDNNLCGVGMACGKLLDSAHNPITLANGTTLKVAGVTHDVVIPGSFHVFAGNGAGAKVNIGADDALFQVKGNSHLTINGVQVQ